MVLALFAACRSEAPGSRGAVPDASVAAAPPAEPSSALTPAASATGAPVVAGSAPTLDAGEPSLFGADGKLLPQTEDEPKSDSPLFVRRLDLLFAAIVKGDAEIARPFFFPVEAYEVVKGIEKPAADWKARLWALFVRDVKRYHDALGPDPDKAKLVGFEPSANAKWMKPGAEGNLIGYHRMTRNKLLVTAADGKQHKLEITSLISWRGEWYVVHLNGFK
jgi:hypothetical protein